MSADDLTVTNGGTGNGGAPIPGSPEVVEGADQPTDRPSPDFEITAVQAVARAAAPTLRFTAKASDEFGFEIYSIALVTQISVEPAKRRYDDETRARLVELFGEPERWSSTTHSFPWARADTLVPSFRDETEFSIDVPCTYDLEVAAAKYFYSLPDGVAPLGFHFTGTVLYRDGDDRLQSVLIAWDRLSRFGMPVETWQRMMDFHYPGGGWIALDKVTLDRLHDHKSRAGRMTMSDTINDLLDSAGGGPEDAS